MLILTGSACRQGPIQFTSVESTTPATGTNPVPAANPNSKITYAIVDTGQTKCYDDIKEITGPKPGEAFFGQDAQYQGNQPGYSLSTDGLTVSDSVTGLTWQRSPDLNGDGALTASDKLTWPQARARPAALNTASYGGFNDWRLPTIKELYSLIKFSGTDPSNMTGDDKATPFIDTNYFKFAYGEVNAGERIIDSQYASSTLYVSKGLGGELLFGVNFADGRIKGYGLNMAGPGGPPQAGGQAQAGVRPAARSQAQAGGRLPSGEKTFFVQCVRGNTEYGKNHFVSNGDGTITDSASGLMWSKSDSGSGMNWKEALAWVQTKNAANYLGHHDWRLPDAKELQSILDYTRSPDTTSSAAIDPLFSCTQIMNEAGQTDYGFYWTSTTHASSRGSGGAGAYVAFGRSMGYMNGRWQDVHGAGAQRSDPKSGDPANYATGRGPQGDSIHINNYVRLVRGGNVTFTTKISEPTVYPSPTAGQQAGPGQPSANRGTRPGDSPGGTAGNLIGGRVTAVNGYTISGENLEGKVSIVTDASTKFTVNEQTGSLTSVTAGKFVTATGQKQADGSWLATQVIISDTPPGPPPQ
jgi:hypothetical protein